MGREENKAGRGRSTIDPEYSWGPGKNLEKRLCKNQKRSTVRPNALSTKGRMFWKESDDKVNGNASLGGGGFITRTGNVVARTLPCSETLNREQPRIRKKENHRHRTKNTEERSVHGAETSRRE